MTNCPTSRRSFLSSLAILSAGVAFGSVTDLISGKSPKPDLQGQWDRFRISFGGGEYAGRIAADTYQTAACTGHYLQKGKMIYFSREGLLAQPEWIFWGNERQRPADMVVTFFEMNEVSFKKVKTYNRFEMEAVYKAAEKLKGLSFIKTGDAGKLSNKTTIRKFSQTHEIKYFNQQTLVFEDHIVYYV